MCVEVWRCGRYEDSVRILNETGKQREERREEGGNTIHPQYAQIISK